MARVLIAEPVDDIRILLGLMVAQLGHEATFADAGATDEIDADVALIEPASAQWRAIASALRDGERRVPIIFVSIAPPTPETRALSPVRHVVKPFDRAELAAALEVALGSG
jgi:CheY-like chemotaxis protein